MNKNELLRGLPKIDEVMRQESLVVLSEEKGSLLVTNAVRSVITGLRESILSLKEVGSDGFDKSVLGIDAVAAEAVFIEPRAQQSDETDAAIDAAFTASRG